MRLPLARAASEESSANLPLAANLPQFATFQEHELHWRRRDYYSLSIYDEESELGLPFLFLFSFFFSLSLFFSFLR
jgi:hypothetical protein